MHPKQQSQKPHEPHFQPNPGLSLTSEAKPDMACMHMPSPAKTTCKSPSTQPAKPCNPPISSKTPVQHTHSISCGWAKSHLEVQLLAALDAAYTPPLLLSSKQKHKQKRQPDSIHGCITAGCSAAIATHTAIGAVLLAAPCCRCCCSLAQLQPGPTTSYCPKAQCH